MRKKSNNCRIDPTIQATYMVKISLGKISPPERSYQGLKQKILSYYLLKILKKDLYHMGLV
jgi:hypothetical protein